MSGSAAVGVAQEPVVELLYRFGCECFIILGLWAALT
jgi:hypothetical protein